MRSIFGTVKTHWAWPTSSTTGHLRHCTRAKPLSQTPQSR